MELVDFASLLVAGGVLAGIFKGIASVVFARWGGKPRAGLPGWRGYFYLSMWAQPIAAGAALGLIEQLPAPEFMGGELAGRVMWYALGGVLSSTLYDAVRTWIKHQAGVKYSLRPPPPPSENETPTAEIELPR